jgi:hypothetical protein
MVRSRGSREVTLDTVRAMDATGPTADASSLTSSDDPLRQFLDTNYVPLVCKMHVVQAQLATARAFLQGLEGPAAAACLRAMQECEREVHNKAALSLDDILEDVDDEEKEE